MISPGSADGVLRVATYNVRGLRDDRRALVRVIRALRPDVLCLQEAPRLPGWRRERRTLARAAGLSVAAGGRVGGTAVLIAPAVRLLRGRGHRLRWFAGLEWRSVALAVVEKDRERYAVCSAHLDLLAAARLSHAAQIVPLLERAAREFGAAPVLAGDLNEAPGAPVWRLLGGRYTDCFTAARGPAPATGSATGSKTAPGTRPIMGPITGLETAADGDAGRAGATFPARDPRVRIDAIFAGPDLTVVSYGGADVPPGDLAVASDHRPVVAEIAFAPSARA